MALRGHQHFWRQGLAVDRPATPGYDMGYFATDTGQLSIYDSGGAAWSNVGFSGLSDPVAIADGGTGQTSKTPAFDALAPPTTKGDIIVYDGTDNIRLAVGSDGALLIADSTTGSGLAWARRPESYPLFAASQATTYTWTPGAAYTAFGGTGQSNLHKRDFTYFTEARIYARGFLRNLVSGSILMKIVDTTNTVDITPDITFVDPTDLGVWADHTSAWTALNALTTGDCQYEAQALSDDDPLQSVIVGTISLELR